MKKNTKKKISFDFLYIFYFYYKSPKKFKN